ncbi:RHS repeat-associated core domain-containing protein [Fibrobacter sp. UWH3]|uniref:RHS repeat domain-containing protein n=1 Tax=Fibrobacter sp. UWH3 TaxID=1964353 RepID=UPI000B525B40|nr:RHS repeat-associated core domain-containing protein [Fibrobacter sp. UWH3]OWV06176.1 hypothetical protein B7993_06355 [Fibrobacter sp. UWH3]
MVTDNFVYDSEGNLIEDKSKNLKIFYDWRGMPVEFRMETRADDGSQPTRGCSRDSVRVLMAYDGSGRRVSKTRMRKACDGEWERELVTHYTGIGTEVRESFHNGTPSETKVVVNMPQGLGRYGVEDATDPFYGVDKMQLAGYIPSAKFEWFLKNHLGSTMLVYGTSAYNDTYFSGYKGGVQAAYDYRAFGEQVSLMEPADKVTETFTGKERDDETELNYFGARYLDPMLGMWISVDPARQFSSPYLYAGNGVNPVNGVDGDGRVFGVENEKMLGYVNQKSYSQFAINSSNELYECMVCRVNPSGSLNYSSRINAAIKSNGVVYLTNVPEPDEMPYLKANGGAASFLRNEGPTAVVLDYSSDAAQDALHEMVSHTIPALLGDRDGNSSAVNEEIMNTPGYKYISPLDVPEHPIDQSK